MVRNSCVVFLSSDTCNTFVAKLPSCGCALGGVGGVDSTQLCVEPPASDVVLSGIEENRTTLYLHRAQQGTHSMNKANRS